MLNIAPALYGQSKKYVELWLYILNEVHRGNNTFVVADLLEETSLSRQSLSLILKRGVQVFGEIGVDVLVARKHATDKHITVTVGQLSKQEVKSKTKVPETRHEQPKSTNDQLAMAVNAIVTYLNQSADKSFRVDNKNTIQLIKSRIKDGFNFEQFKYVIDVKVAHWKNTDMEKYLRPETLFGNKFESYLNETFANNKSNVAFRNAEESINKDW